MTFVEALDSADKDQKQTAYVAGSNSEVSSWSLGLIDSSLQLQVDYAKYQLAYEIPEWGTLVLNELSQLDSAKLNRTSSEEKVS